jgi:DNA polymerase/3'-5' exonuclease PolX
MNLPLATLYAQQIVTWLTPFCERIEIAGSIRRQRPIVNDIDLVCIPKIHEETDLLGAVSHRANRLFDYLVDYVRERNPSSSQHSKPHFISGGEREGKQMILQLPKCQLDLWFASEENLATRLLMRTGSKEHNIWFAQRAQDKGLSWKPYEGLFQTVFSDIPPLLPCATEESLYRAIGFDYIDPVNRESTWLTSSKL